LPVAGALAGTARVLSRRPEATATAIATGLWGRRAAVVASEMIMQRSKPIFVVQGNKATRQIMERAADALGVADRVVGTPDEAEPLAHLHRLTGRNPSVIILSVGEGSPVAELAILGRIKADERLRTVPVVVLAPSNDAALIEQSFALGAVGYVVEPFDAREVARAVQAIDEYWSLSQLPGPA
jgi:CheY-like chemotaxis protein